MGWATHNSRRERAILQRATCHRIGGPYQVSLDPDCEASRTCYAAAGQSQTNVPAVINA